VTARIVLSLGPCAPFGGSPETLSRKGSDIGLLLGPLAAFTDPGRGEPPRLPARGESCRVRHGGC
jgi:hypothetical protein